MKCWQCHKATLPPPRPKTGPADRRGPLRKAYESGDNGALITAVLATTEPSGDCMIWLMSTNDGYPTIKIARRSLAVHRLVLEAKMGARLGSQAAHHICANTLCLNPDHLQPVTHRENVAEMLARQSYLARIRELEAALAMCAPDHPLLDMVQVA